MFDRVIDEVEHGFGQPVAISTELSVIDGVEAPRPGRDGASLGENLMGEDASIDHAERKERRILHARQRLQIVDQSTHPGQLVEHEGQDSAPSLFVIIRVEQLKVTRHHRQRSPQLVTRRPDERHLSLMGPLEPIEHLVDRRCHLHRLG